MLAKDTRTAERIAENLALANEFAEPGTVKHFALRLGFMPDDEAKAEAILEQVIHEGEEYRDRLEALGEIVD